LILRFFSSIIKIKLDIKGKEVFIFHFSEEVITTIQYVV
jgi:hypothetical protein